jgi:transcriptional antiterminator RfaH
MSAPEPRWYVVQTNPNAEGKAYSHLVRQGFEAYLPRYLKRRRHARRIENVLAPLFPRYLFVSVDIASQRWRAIRSTIGVSRLVCNGDVPACVHKGVVHALKLRETAGSGIKLDPQPRFAAGERVRIVDGVFGNCFGLFDGMADRDRVAILLDLLGRKVRVLVEDLSVVAA